MPLNVIHYPELREALERCRELPMACLSVDDYRTIDSIFDTYDDGTQFGERILAKQHQEFADVLNDIIRRANALAITIAARGPDEIDGRRANARKVATRVPLDREARALED